MRLFVARGAAGDPVRLVIATLFSVLLAWWFLAVNASGEIAMRAGSRAARGTFAADRVSDPEQFNIALAFIGLLFLIAFAAAASAAWDMIAVHLRDRRERI